METLTASKSLEDVFVDHVRLREARIRKGLHIRDVAKAIGREHTHINHYESGRALPPADILARLCILYECDLSQLTKKI